MFFCRQKVEMNSQSCIIFCSFFETLCFICLNRFCHHRLFVFFFPRVSVSSFLSAYFFLCIVCHPVCMLEFVPLTSLPRLTPTPHKPQFFHPFVFGQSLAKSPICQRVQRSACSKVSSDVHSENPATGAKLVCGQHVQGGR